MTSFWEVPQSMPWRRRRAAARSCARQLRRMVGVPASRAGIGPKKCWLGGSRDAPSGEVPAVRRDELAKTMTQIGDGLRSRDGVRRSGKTPISGRPGRCRPVDPRPTGMKLFHAPYRRLQAGRNGTCSSACFFARLAAFFSFAVICGCFCTSLLRRLTLLIWMLLGCAVDRGCEDHYRLIGRPKPARSKNSWRPVCRLDCRAPASGARPRRAPVRVVGQLLCSRCRSIWSCLTGVLISGYAGSPITRRQAPRAPTG